MSNTPRTDAVSFDPKLCHPDMVVDANFARELERENNRYTETLHDGYTVYGHLTEHQRSYTTPENVSAVLDAFKKALANNADQTHGKRAPSA